MTTPTTTPANVPAALNVAAALAAAGFDPSTIAQALLGPTVYPTLTATELARVLRDPRVAPAITRAALSAALTSTNRYQATQVTAALDAVSTPPPDTPPPVRPMDSNNAFGLSGGGYLRADASPAYNFGVGDFTVEAAVCTTAPGTVLARGGAGNGGFQLEIMADGAVRFTTADGTGFFACTTPSTVLDGEWHHIAAARAGARISLFIDGQPTTADSLANATPPLDVDSDRWLTIGTTDPAQESRALTGQLAEVRLWSGARTPDQIRQDMWSRLRFLERFNEPGLVGRWSGEFGAVVDLSPTRNITTQVGKVAAVPGPPASDPGSGVNPYVGVYDLSTRTQPGGSDWTYLGPLYLFPTRILVFLGKVPRGGGVVSGSELWWRADEAIGMGEGLVTCVPDSLDPYYWSGVTVREPVLQGTYRPLGAAGVELRGQRRPSG